MSLRSPLGQVRGMGAAGGGVHHWWSQRLSSLALIPLTLWFALALFGLPQLDYLTVREWMATGLAPVLLGLLVIVLTHHSWLGVQVIVLPGRVIAEDSLFEPRITIARNHPSGRYRAKQIVERV